MTFEDLQFFMIMTFFDLVQTAAIYCVKQPSWLKINHNHVKLVYNQLFCRNVAVVVVVVADVIEVRKMLTVKDCPSVNKYSMFVSWGIVEGGNEAWNLHQFHMWPSSFISPNAANLTVPGECSRLCVSWPLCLNLHGYWIFNSNGTEKNKASLPIFPQKTFWKCLKSM